MKPLFIGLGSSAPCWYRIALPATALDEDWIGLSGGPPGVGGELTGNIEDVNVNDYDTFVVQQPSGEDWYEWIKKQQARGAKVYFEVDDFLHGIHKIEEHTFRQSFNKKAIKKFVECMKLCDGMICSTDYLSNQYKKYNDNQFVCKVGLDTPRYDIELPSNEHVVVGWAGGTGHTHAIVSWLFEINRLMGEHDNVRFVSIGTAYADAINMNHPGRALYIPWLTIENYPYALSGIDINIAPAHTSKYHQSKSDLRWLEASAVGIPTIVHPSIYPEVVDGETGFVAEDEVDFAYHLYELVNQPEKGKEVAQRAKKYVQENRDIRNDDVKGQWTKVLESQAK